MSFASAQANLLEFFEPQLRDRGANPGTLAVLRDDLRMFHLRSRWDRASSLEKIAALPAARRRGQLSWLLPRIMGLPVFAATKLLVRSYTP
jgi:hypothetical protein